MSAMWDSTRMSALEHVPVHPLMSDATKADTEEWTVKGLDAAATAAFHLKVHQLKELLRGKDRGRPNYWLAERWQTFVDKLNFLLAVWKAKFYT